MKLASLLAAALLAVACADQRGENLVPSEVLDGSKNKEVIPMHHAVRAVFRELIAAEKQTPGAAEAKLLALGLDSTEASAVYAYAVAAEDDIASTMTRLARQACGQKARLSASRSALADEITASDRVLKDKAEALAGDLTTVIGGRSLNAFLDYVSDARAEMAMLPSEDYVARLESPEVDPAALMTKACQKEVVR
jgi:hypothetical protein